MMLAGWGRYPRADCALSAPRDEDALRALLRGAEAGVIARGLGRAYGDSAMNRGCTIDMRHFNRLLGFDPASGRICAEAGVILGDLLRAMLPRGWFPPVTPGTKFVTLGGMIAADVHGKNHHRAGSFGGFVDWIDVMGADGGVTRASREENADLFHWTIGGMGLTGVILRAGFRMTPVETGWIRQRLIATPDLGATMDAFDAADAATYSVAWIDCLARGRRMGRALVMLGEHAARADLPLPRARAPFHTPPRPGLSVPIDAPGFALGPFSVRAFNAAYYLKGRLSAGESLIDWDRYFYPLDAVANWNRIYGRRGFAQFQCVLPLGASRAGIAALLGAISASGDASFLSVLKRFGPQESRISFPMAGYTLALDFPMRAGAPELLERLDRITLDHGGRFYLAKDSRMRAETLHAADPRIAAFSDWRRETGAARFASDQSERLQL
jgi:FAD/FMN-containing dehydrogenase